MPNKAELDQRYIQDQLDTLLSIKFAELDAENPLHLFEDLDEIATTYKDARAIAEDESKSEKAREDAGKVMASIAKALPDIAKGTLSAVNAFKKGDVMGGSAAVMDICAAATTMISGILAVSPMLSLAGPVGMLAGAIFSIIGQILAFFGPKQESLIDQIEKLLLELQADSELQKIKTVHDVINNFSKSLKLGARRLTERKKDPESRDGSGRLPSILQTPLKTHKDVKTLRDALKSLVREMKDFNPNSSATMEDFWSVKNWLDNPEKQDQEKWPETLSIWCKSYSDLMTANLTYYGIVRSSDLRRRLEETENQVASSPLDPSDRKDIQDALSALVSLELARCDQMSANNDTALAFLKRIIPIARYRGVFAVAYYDGWLFLGTGRNICARNEFKGVYEHCHRIALAAPRGFSRNPRLSYDAWIMDSWNHNSHHLKLNPLKRIFEDGEEIVLDPKSNPLDGNEIRGKIYERFVDWCAVPTPGSSTGFDIYGTLAYGESGAIEHWTFDTESRALSRISWRPGYPRHMTQVRIAATPTLVAHDPDRSETTEEMVGRAPIIYVALEGSGEILVFGAGFYEFVPIPMSVYKGVAVDSKYLWMYGPHGFACTTHASVMACIAKKRPMPFWLGNGQKENIPNVIDMSSCDDDTVLVSTQEAMFTSPYHVDFVTAGTGEGERLSIEKWEKLVGGAGAGWVQKLPIFGWPLLASLAADLAPKRPGSV